MTAVLPETLHLQGRDLRTLYELIHHHRRFAILIPTEERVPSDFTIPPEATICEFAGGVPVPITDEKLADTILTAIRRELDLAQELVLQ